MLVQQRIVLLFFQIVLYLFRQYEIIKKITEILSLNETNTITLYELDNDIEKQNKLLYLIPIIRKYFSFNNIKAIGEPYRIKSPQLSIIKQLTKEKYKITSEDYRLKLDDKIIRTKLYTFYKI